MIYPEALVNSKKELIQAFRASKYGIQLDGSVSPGQKELREDLTNAVEQLSTGLYEKNVHFLMELIQNAEDNAYQDGIQPQLKLVLLDEDPTATAGSDGCLCVFNNETGFSQENIKGISGVGKSTKKNIEGYIGEKGIGFKSVFIVSASPHIFSNGYQIRFLEKDEAFDLNYIVPYWVDHVPDVVRDENMTTSLLLPLKPGKKTEIIEHLKSIKPESLLFLKKLRSLSIEIPNESTIHIAVSDPDNGVVNLAAEKEGKTSINRYWLYSEPLGVPQYLKEGEKKEEKREGIHKIEITLALPLDKSEVEGRVFAYLPTEVDSGLPFLINSDFLLTANRESLQANQHWNQWLKAEMSGVILKALEKMRVQAAYCKTFYRYIPLEANLGALSDYFSPIVSEVNTALSEKSLVLTTTGKLLKACNTRFPKKRVRELFSRESLPLWFDSLGFVDPDLTRFDKQIKEIGGKDLGKTELPFILEDKSWLDKQPDSWLVNLWSLLSDEKYKKEAVGDKYLIPTNHGERKRADDHVFYAYNAELIASIPEGSRDLVNFLPKGFFEREIFEYLKSEGLVYRFSLDNFVAGVWLSYVNGIVADNFSVKWFLDENRFLCRVLPDLDERTRTFVKSKFYILNEEDEPVSLATKGSKQILFPRSFDEKLGWQLFFDPEKDHGDCEVLSEQYMSLKSVDRDLKSYLIILGAAVTPMTAEKATSNRNTSSDLYREFAFDGFSSHYTGGTIPALHYYPNISGFSEIINNETKRKAYLHWVENYTERSVSRPYIEYQYQFKRKHWVSESAVIYEAKRAPWIRTQRGLKIPSEVFVDTDSTREVLGNTVPYLEDEVSEELRHKLGIREKASSSELIQYLKDASSGQGEIDQSVLLKVYKYLNSADIDNEELEDLFTNEALIYVAEQGWMKSTQSIWENAEAVFGSSHGWLSKHYPNLLEDFFVNQLGVKKQVDDDTYIDAWLTFQQRTVTSAAEVESFITEAMPRIIKMIKTDPSRKSLDLFRTKALIWSQSKMWLTPNKLYTPDNQKLAKIFESKLKYVWRLPDRSFESMLPLLDDVGVSNISDAVSYEINSPSRFKFRPNELLTKHSVRLLAYFLNSEDRDEQGVLEERLDNGLFGDFYKVEEVVVSKLVIDVSVGLYSAEIVDQTCYLDLENQRIYIDDSAGVDDVKEELSAILKRVLFGGRRGSFEDTILRLLAVNDKKREAKIREEKGWHLPKDLLKKLNAIEKPLTGSMADKQKSNNQKDDAQIKSNGSKPESKKLAEDNAATGYHSNSNPNTNHSFKPLKPPAQNQSNGSKPEPKKSAESNARIGYHLNSNFKTNNAFNTEKPPAFAQQERQSQESSTSNRLGSPKARPGTSRLGSPKARSGTSSASRNASRSSGNFAKTGKSKSNPKNNIRTGRMRSYVSRERLNGDQPASSRNEFNKSLGDAAEKIVSIDLTNKGFDVEEMPDNNRGYDFEALNRDTGELFYIEVKGSFTPWSAKGVAISKPQYQLADQYQDNYILAVVDNLQFNPGQPVYLRNPVGNITEYCFDNGWADAAIDFDLDESVPQKVLIIDPISERLDLTDSEVCKSLLRYCDDEGFPIPEVGVELQNDAEEVVFDSLELCWEEERVAIVLDQDDFEQAGASTDGWTFWIADDAESLKERLDETFG